MKLWFRHAQITSDPTTDSSLTNVQPADPSLPDIPAPAGSALGAITVAAASASGVLAETSALITSTPTAHTTPTSQTSSTSHTAASATATATPAPSHGLSPGKLTAAIVVPIGFLAVLIPILVLWFLDHRRNVAAQKRASQRSSQRSAKAWEAMPMTDKFMPVVEKEYRGSAPARPPPADRIPTRKPVPEGPPQLPPLRTGRTPQRTSLGLFNFELSPSSTYPNSRNSTASPRWRLSIARALELRRSEVAVTQVYARSSGGSEHRPVTSHSNQQPQPQSQIHIQPEMKTQDNHNRQSETSNYNDPPPPYMTPRPSEAGATHTHFAPLDRIGTRQQANRLSATHIAGQLNRDSLAPEAQRNTYASSEIIPLDTYGHVRTRSSSPSTRSSEGHLSAHNNGPFSYGLPERLSDVSRLSFDAEHWGRGNQQLRRSGGSDVSALDSDESSTRHPHQII